MAVNLKQGEYLADTILHKAEELMAERARLREELMRRTRRGLMQEKAIAVMFEREKMESVAREERERKLLRMLGVK